MWNTITTSTNTNKILFIVLMLISICSDINPQNGKSGNNKFTEFISKAFKLGLTPGMAVGVVKDNEVIYAEGFGVTDITAGEKVSPETLFYIASTTKSFTGLAGALLDHESLLDLDKPFTDYLPDFEFNTELKDSVITLRELLTHTHGIAENLPVIIRTAYTGDFTNDLLLSLLKNSIPAEKGRAFDYTNLGYVIYGLVMDEQFESGWKTMLEQKIFKPLGMYNTHAYIGNADKENLAMPHQIASNGYSILHYGKTTANMHAAGGHISSVNDLAKWLLVHINRGKLNGVQIFPEKVINETHRLGAVQDREFGNIKRYGWGLGWDLGVYDGDTIIHRFGSFTGFRSHVSFMPSHKLGVVVLVNEAVTGSYLADLVAEYIYDLLLEKPRLSNKYTKVLSVFEQRAETIKQKLSADLAKRSSRQQKLPFPVTSYAGEYFNRELGKIRLTLKGGKLHLHMGASESDVEVYDSGKNKLRIEIGGNGLVITFSFDENGQAEKFILWNYEFDRIE